MNIEDQTFEIPTMKFELTAREVRALLAIMNDYLESENVSKKSINGWVEEEITQMKRTLDTNFYLFLAKIREASGGVGIFIQEEKVLEAFNIYSSGYSDSQALSKLLEASK